MQVEGNMFITISIVSIITYALVLGWPPCHNHSVTLNRYHILQHSPQEYNGGSEL